MRRWRLWKFGRRWGRFSPCWWYIGLPCCARDPSLRLKNGSDRDDAIGEKAGSGFARDDAIGEKLNCSTRLPIASILEVQLPHKLHWRKSKYEKTVSHPGFSPVRCKSHRSNSCAGCDEERRRSEGRCRSIAGGAGWLERARAENNRDGGRFSRRQIRFQTDARRAQFRRAIAACRQCQLFFHRSSHGTENAGH